MIRPSATGDARAKDACDGGAPASDLQKSGGVQPSSLAAEAIRFEGYSFAYAGSDANVLSDIGFTLAQGSFTVLCGLSGSGKSTLLRAMKPELAVAGSSSGLIRILGQDPASFDPVKSASLVGFVQQDPVNQLVTDTVWHELAFGLENIGLEQETMRRRVAETAHFFGIGAWFDRKVNDLSGGQKQLLNLAAVVVMQPRVLVLDEPTSQLDPIAAKDFLDVLGRVNSELGITVVIIEHRLEDVLPLSDHVLYLEEGRLGFFGASRAFIGHVLEMGDAFAAALPAATRIARLFLERGSSPVFHAEEGGQGSDEPAGKGGLDPLDGAALLPVTVREGRKFLAEQSRTEALLAYPGCPQTDIEAGETVLWTRDLWFRYEKSMPFVLRGVDFCVRAGRVAAIVGGNGSGKSTLLCALAGVRKPERGKVRKAPGKKVAMLAQDPKMLFVCDTLLDDLLEWQEQGAYGKEQVCEIMDRFEISHLGSHHPYDLSGGEIQKAALAKVLLLDPDVLLLDEPVKGIDAIAKAEVGEIFKELAARGKAVLFTAHDLEFTAGTAEICSMMFGCEITCTQDTRGFFTDNLFYSTATSRITRGLMEGCVGTDDVACALGVGDAD